jgi:serine/threonine-protein kinase RsbW
MLKIWILDKPSHRRLVVEGKLTEPWVSEFQSAWSQARQEGRNGRMKGAKAQARRHRRNGVGQGDSISNNGPSGASQRSPAPRSDFQVPQLVVDLERVIPSDLSFLDATVAEISATIERIACWEEPESIGLAVREAIANAIIHGNHRDPARTVRVHISVNEECDLLITVEDSGLGFDPNGLANPTAAPNLLANHGRGIFLMKQLMDRVDFKFDQGTEVRMSKRRQWIE